MKKQWDDFVDVCLGLGVRPGTLRQWKHVGKVPQSWQIKIVQETGGAISFSRMNEEDFFGPKEKKNQEPAA